MNVANDPIVHFVLDRDPNKGEHRPAIVVKVFPANIEGNLVSLQVFTDSDPHGRYNDQIPSPYWRTSVKYDESGAVGTWHYPEREDVSAEEQEAQAS